jgi:hypothetical protein
VIIDDNVQTPYSHGLHEVSILLEKNVAVLRHRASMKASRMRM